MPKAAANGAPAADGRWIAYEENAAVRFGKVAATSAKNVCLQEGKKVPQRRVWLDHLPPPSAALSTQIDAACQQLPVERLWRAAGGKTLTLAELSAAAGSDSTVWQLATLTQVLANPIYFRRSGSHLIPTATATVQKALAAIAKRQQQQAHETQLVAELAAGGLPDEIKTNMMALLLSTDKTSPGHRALKKHLAGDGTAFVRFFIRQGLLSDELDYLEKTFARQWYYPPQPAKMLALPPLPVATAATLSIDDAGTKEVDDAFSIKDLTGGGWRLGIHIAAPALLLPPNATPAQARLVSVYFPHAKHFMLPETTLAACSLTIGTPRPALSLYAKINADGWHIEASRIEMLQLDHATTPTKVDDGDMPPAIAAMVEKLQAAADILAPQMSLPSNDDAYKIDTTAMRIVRRRRNGIARVVEIFMRMANTVWGQQLAAAGSGGLFRVEGGLKLRPPPSPYMWLTSPLRRYVDLANQRQLLALLAGTKPPKEDWRQLRYNFERQYTLARRAQHTMDTYWALRILAEQTPTALAGSYLGRQRVRLAEYPLSGTLDAPLAAPVDSAVTVHVKSIDLLRQRLVLTAA